MWTKTPSLLLLLLISNIAESLLVVPSSPQCAALCGNTLDATSGAEMTCHDADYATSAYGATFKACIACELSSPYYDTVEKQADLQWAIYNIRYALSWCLFGFDNNTSVANTPCLTSFSCAPLQNAVEYSSLNQNASTYSYCPIFTASTTTINSCAGCLRETESEYYLANFINVLSIACTQQPAPGDPLSFTGTVFSSTQVNATSPTAVAAAAYKPSTGLSLAAKVGIAVGGLVVFLIAMGIFIVCRGKRRRRAVLAAHQRASASNYLESQRAQTVEVSRPSSFASHSHAAPREQFFDSPASQVPLRRELTWDCNSPQSASTEKAYFSPYQSQYNSPVSALDGPSHGGSWGTDTKGIFGTMEPAIELRDVHAKDPRGPGWQPAQPPTLQHPRPR